LIGIAGDKIEKIEIYPYIHTPTYTNTHIHKFLYIFINKCVIK